ncbi:MAG: c-type cytochrome, partial [Sulfurovaceae bacterium]|nr:c-type cytochrome [Sulfurovaceae bacterium]
MHKLKVILFVLLVGVSSQAQEYPQGVLGKTVKLGEDIINHTDTHPLTKDLVDSKLQCKNCHLKVGDGKTGTTKNIGTFIGTAGAFPAYSSRFKRVQTLQERVDGCFLRCMGGKKSILNTEAGIAMTSYITWISRGTKVKMNPKGPRSFMITKLWEEKKKSFKPTIVKATHQNYLRGQALYKKKCVACHGLNGEGNDKTPPLWGKDAKGKWLSYTADGSMSKLDNSAVWIQSNMPMNQANTLSDN